MTQFFFKINLNKFGELRLQKQNEKKTFLTFTLLFGICTVLLFGVVLFLNHNLDRKLQNRKSYLKETEQQVSMFQTSGDYLSSNDLDRLSHSFTNRIFWARKLVALAERTQNQMAITHFSYKNGVLSLFGLTKVDKGQKEFDLIDQFISTLKSNQQISQDFPDVKFVRSTRDREKDTDIIRFQIDCIGENYSKREDVK